MLTKTLAITTVAALVIGATSASAGTFSMSNVFTATNGEQAVTVYEDGFNWGLVEIAPAGTPMGHQFAMAEIDGQTYVLVGPAGYGADVGPTALVPAN